ncbi:PilZ domain-containing protein [Thiolapillus sp.]
MAMPGFQQGIINLSIKDKDTLYRAYMPFVENGGLFIPTIKKYELGDDVFILLNLMDDAERVPVAGKVIWITPVGAMGNRTAGIGVQFGPHDEGATRNKIEIHLAGMLELEKPTDTM